MTRVHATPCRRRLQPICATRALFPARVKSRGSSQIARKTSGATSATITGIEIDADTRTVRIDWHRYSLDQVETWADRVVEAAWEHGFDYVEFVHGAADVGARGSLARDGSAAVSRGTIKQMLRQRLFGNRWHRWARERREGMHHVEEGRMLVALRENPRPARDARWPMVPPPAHG
jgi:hypothetical protein